jgi:hypothetical protein
MEPGVVEVFFDVELVLFELAVDDPVEVDPTHLVCLVEGAPEVSEREVDAMLNAEVRNHSAELDARFVAVTPCKNDMAAYNESSPYLQCSDGSCTDDDVCALIFLESRLYLLFESIDVSETRHDFRRMRAVSIRAA